MNLPVRINEVIDYIEMNLEEKIEYAHIAKIACLSEHHFARVFAAVMDISLSEYIRNRRLTVAAFELLNSEIKILDLGVKYGYESADAFSRAFQKFHGVRPSVAREKGTQLKTFPKLSIQIEIKGGSPVEFRLEEVDMEFDIVGVKKWVETHRSFETVPALWHEAEQNGLLGQLINMSWENPQCQLESLLGVSGKTSTIDEDAFEYMMGVRYKGQVPKNMEPITIPKSTWAVFPNTNNSIWKQIYTEWLPTSGYSLGDIPLIECFYPPGHEPGKEIWVPIIKE